MAQDIFELETKYLEAKEAYYTGEPIMDDFEFDELENLLKTMDSDVINLVGTVDRNFKHNHLSQMSSLAKQQTHYDDKGNIMFPMDDINKWLEKFPTKTLFEASCKYDGMAINLIYRANGKGKANFEKAITRGDKLKGKDATNKFMRAIPLTIDSDVDVEVRGEAMVTESIFNANYKNHTDPTVRKYKNPRNFVAGVVNRDSVSSELLKEIQFMAIEVRLHDGDYFYPKDTTKFLKANGFNSDYNAFTLSFTKEDFKVAYYGMKTYRENVSDFQLDGFVIKAPENIRVEHGVTGHHPNWALAIKFPPVPAITTVRGIKETFSVNGESIPGLMLEPVELDGTTVRNTAGYNWGTVIEKGLFPGAKVEIVKSGDIIPIVSKIITPQYKGTLPTTCGCGAPLILEGIHLNCSSDDCSIKAKKRFIVGVGRYEMKKWGGATRSQLWESGIKNIVDIFDPSIFNKENLIASGFFKDGKTLDNLFIEKSKIETVTLQRIIHSLGFNGVGGTMSKQLAKYIRGKEYDFKGLEKKALEGFELGDPKREKIENLVNAFEALGITIEEEIEIIGGIGYEMTGSPKDTEFPVKREFEKFLLTNGYVHKKLKESKYLVTDSMDSKSGKMKQAVKLGIEIMLYQDLLNQIKSS